MMKHLALVLPLLLVSCTSDGSGSRRNQPIIDVHLHAEPADWHGTPAPEWVPAGLAPAKTDDELMRDTLSALERHNVVTAFASGPIEFVKRWQMASPERIVPSLWPENAGRPGTGATLDVLEAEFRMGNLGAMAEVGWQYHGISPADPEAEPYLALAERLDLPVGIHMGLGPPGVNYEEGSKYRAALGNPLLLEEALIRHPTVRVWIMHAGWPLLSETIALMHAHPQVYADVAVINWYLPRPEFHEYLRRLVQAGLGKRLMYGSDQMVWPGAISLAIEGIESADFLSVEQKRDIFYHNAVRFFRLQNDQSHE